MKKINRAARAAVMREAELDEEHRASLERRRAKTLPPAIESVDDDPDLELPFGDPRSFPGPERDAWLASRGRETKS